MKILVIEDDPQALALIRWALQEGGNAVDAAATGEAIGLAAGLAAADATGLAAGLRAGDAEAGDAAGEAADAVVGLLAEVAVGMAVVPPQAVSSSNGATPESQPRKAARREIRTNG